MDWKVFDMKARKLVKAQVLLAAVLLTLAVGMALQGQNVYAKTIKRVAYNGVMKYKSTAYCASCAGIYKVKIRNGRLVSKTCLMKEEVCYGPYSLAGSMRKKGGYVYYVEGTNGTTSYLKRAGIRSHKAQLLSNYTFAYAIKGKKLYYSVEKDWDSISHKVMTLSGKHKKKTSIKVKMTNKSSNAKGYKIVEKEKGKYVISYLKTPKGKYKLGKVFNYSY